MKTTNSKLILFSYFLLILSFSNPLFAQKAKGEILIGKTTKEQFGRNVKLSKDGSILAVAAPFNSEFSDKNGRIAIYKFTNNKWTQMGNAVYPDKRDFEYGAIMELSADGSKLIVGAPFRTINFYAFDGTDWKRTNEQIILENEFDQIETISVTEDVKKLAVSYYSQKIYSNCVKIFKSEDQKWVQEGNTIMPNEDALSKKGFGESISLFSNGNCIAVGDPYANSKNLKNTGGITIYKLTGNNWVKTEPKFNGSLQGAYLGKNVVASNNGKTIIASSSSIDFLNNTAGYVETYEMHNEKWTNANFTLKPEKQNAFFGHSIAISDDGTILTLSLPYLGFKKPGYVKVFKKTPDSWKELTTITDADGIESTPMANNSTGWCIDISSDGKTIAIGFPHNDENGDMSGKVIVYDLSALN
ncbi:hypothetical protein [Flavobacterium pedocola]